MGKTTQDDKYACDNYGCDEIIPSPKRGYYNFCVKCIDEAKKIVQKSKQTSLRQQNISTAIQDKHNRGRNTELDAARVDYNKKLTALDAEDSAKIKSINAKYDVLIRDERIRNGVPGHYVLLAMLLEGHA